MVDEVWTGGCNCRAVRYRIKGPLHEIWLCHCDQCIRHHGHVGAYTKCDQEQITLTEDQGLSWWRQPDEEKRGFCRICGAALFSVEAARPEIMFVTAGTLDETRSLHVSKHMCFNEKRPYYDVNDDMPKLDYHE